MEQHLATKAHKPQLNKLMESDITVLTGTAVDKQALAVLN
jgi:hypothetical protein